MRAVSAPALLVRRPSPQLDTGELTHLDRVPVDAALALEQWRAYVDVFRSTGWTVHEVEPADAHPDGVFVEDTVVLFDDLAVLTSPGAASRVGEVASTAQALEQLADGHGLQTARIEPPGHLEGGDVLKVGRTAYVGLTSRTDADGIAQLRALVEPRGWTVVAVPVTKVLHLKSGVTALPDGTVIGWTPNVDDPSGVRRLPRGAGGARDRGRRPRRWRRRHVGGRSADRGAAARARADGARGGDHRVREARGVRDLPVGARPTVTVLHTR